MKLETLRNFPSVNALYLRIATQLLCIRSEVVREWFLVLLAEAYGKAGRGVEGLRDLATALALMQEDGGHFYEAELYRLKGELTLQQSYVPQEAEKCFQDAITVARHQNAKSLELRASTSLARLWQQQDKMREAHQRFAEIYGWFTEGFDTKDLQEAKTVLAELAEDR